MQDFAAHRVWDTALGQLQLQVTRPNYDTWLKDTVGLNTDNGSFVIGTPSDFVSEWLSTKMGPVIAKTVSGILGRSVELRYEVVSQGGNGHQADEPPPLAGHSPAPAVISSPSARKRLNGKLTFDRFIIGESNRLAAAASHAVAEQPGEVYNPLFIYGGPGLGKTHLLHAIASRAAREDRRVLYITCEQFTNDFVNAISQGRQDEFRRKYRSTDILLVDDIQFLAGKERTQEEFFHTFNDLHADGCQVVLTSDHSPKTIPGLQARLCSRFQWGLIADIQPPDLETRMAILASKADQLGLNLEDSIIELIAKRVQKNVRELEGSLNRMVAYSQLMNVAINLESTSNILDGVISDTARHTIEPERIIEEVGDYYRVSTEALLGRGRTKKIAQARQVAMYLLSYELEMSPTQIGRILGGRDHATVIHGAGKINGEINEDSQLRQDVLTIKEAIFAI
ncbi:MAG: chromosomal replication initiator protein DnaA [Chloroflexi bacterium]|nr:chromosomal replication initiator protein DnaA [Chloroflexota bacterium]